MERREQKKKRRPRSAAGERNYLCGCGKAYLSYPALYTHVKNKHEGVFPIGSNARRRVPRAADDEAEQAYAPSPARFAAEFAEFTRQLPAAARVGPAALTAEEARRGWGFALETDARDAAPLRMALAATAEGDAPGGVFGVLARFLAAVHPLCADGFFREYALLAALLARALNEKGELFLDRGEKRRGRVEDTRPFCEGEHVHVLAEMLNLFVAELFPAYLRGVALPGGGLRYLGFEDEHIRHLILMAKYLANWLFHAGHSAYRLEVNVDF